MRHEGSTGNRRVVVDSAAPTIMQPGAGSTSTTGLPQGVILGNGGPSAPGAASGTPGENNFNHSSQRPGEFGLGGLTPNTDVTPFSYGSVGPEGGQNSMELDAAESFENLPVPGTASAAQGDDDDLVSLGARSGTHSRTQSGVSNTSFNQSMILDQMSVDGGDREGSDDDEQQLMEAQEPHHTFAAYPYLNWDLLQLNRSKYSRQYKDRTVETEYGRYAFYGAGRSSLMLILVTAGMALQAIVSPSFPMVTPIDIVTGVLLLLAGGLTFIMQRRKEQLKTYEAVCRNCKRQENLGIFIWCVIALMCFNAGPKFAVFSADICGSLCSGSMRVAAFLTLVGMLGLRIVPRLHILLPIIVLSYILFVCGLLVATDPVELHNHGEVIHSLAAAIFLTFLIMAVMLDRNRRAEFELSIQVYTMQNKWRQQKSQYSAFLSEMMPPAALNRIMRNQHVADVTMEGSVAHCELYDYSNWAQRQQNPHLVLVFVNTFAGALDIRSTGTGMDKVEARGDAYVAVCGVSSPSDNHASRACTYVLTLNRLTSDCVRRTGVHPVSVRCGAHTGPLMGMVIGDRMRYDVFGRALALTRTLCQAAPPGGCCVSYTTQSLINGGSYFKVSATKTRIPLAGVDHKQAVAYTLAASDSWDPDSLVLPPETVVQEVNFTESIRSTFLASTVTNKGSYEPPNALDLKSFAAYTRRRHDASGVTMEEEFSALHRVLKSRQTNHKCLGRFVTVFPSDVEDAYQTTVTVSDQLIPRIVACGFISIVSFAATLTSLIIDGGYTFLTIVCAIVPLAISLLGLLLYKKRVASPVLDAVLLWGPWLAGTLLLSASDIEIHAVLRDPVVFRALSALHHLTIPRRYTLTHFIALDVMVNCVTNCVVSVAYYSTKLELTPIVMTVAFIVLITVFCNGLLLASIYNQKKQSLHRCIYQKITRATELECAVYVALTKIAFPPFCAQEVMDWYLNGKLPEQTVHHYLGPQVVWFASVSVRTVSLEDPSAAGSRLNEFQNELEGLLYRARIMLRFATNGDTVCLSGPVKTNATQASQGTHLVPPALDTPVLVEADIDKAINLSVSLAHSLNDYGKKNSMCVTMVGHVCQDVSAAALGYRRMSYNLIAPDVDQTRRVLYAIPENQVHATPSVAQRFDRMNSQAMRDPNPMSTASVSQVLEDYALKLVFGPVKRHTVPTDGKGTTTVDTNALTEL